MAYEPKGVFEKAAFYVAGIKKASSPTLQPGELNAVTNYWLTLSNTATIFTTILLTIAANLFITTKCWFIYSLPIVGAVYFGIKNWVYGKCASETLKLWL